MKRRTFLNWLGWLFPASSLLGRFTWARPLLRPIQFDEGEVATLRRIAASVLPSALGESGANKVVVDFLRWLREYPSGAKMPHEPEGLDAPLTPEIRVEVYETQLQAIAAAKQNEVPLVTVLQESLADAGIEELPLRPDGRHIVSDLMSFYFTGSQANDLCYRADIGRKTCRGLPGTGDEPPSLADED